MRPVDKGPKPAGYSEITTGVEFEIIDIFHKAAPLVKKLQSKLKVGNGKSQSKLPIWKAKFKPKYQLFIKTLVPKKAPDPKNVKYFEARIQVVENELIYPKSGSIPKLEVGLYELTTFMDCHRTTVENDFQKLNNQYGKSRPFLRAKIGNYCSYCGIDVTIGAAVEHKLPKDKFSEESTKWDNFLLACMSCNSAKGNRPGETFDNVATVSNEYFWPDFSKGPTVAGGYSTYQLIKFEVEEDTYDESDFRIRPSGEGPSVQTLLGSMTSPFPFLRILGFYKGGRFFYGAGRLNVQQTGSMGAEEYLSFDVAPQFKGSKPKQAKYDATIQLTNLSCLHLKTVGGEYHRDRRVAWKFEALKNGIVSCENLKIIKAEASKAPSHQKAKYTTSVTDFESLIQDTAFHSGFFSIWAKVFTSTDYGSLFAGVPLQNSLPFPGTKWASII